MDVIHHGSAEFPPLLAEIPNPPPVLWTRGDRSLFGGPCVAIVGARAATRDGRDIAYQLASDLTRAGIVVGDAIVSGENIYAHT